MDADSKQIMDRNRQLADFVSTDAWKEIRLNLVRKIIDLDTIAGLDLNGDPRVLTRDIAARVFAKEILMDWLGEVEGDANRYISEAPLLKEVKEEEIVRRFD